MLTRMMLKVARMVVRMQCETNCAVQCSMCAAYAFQTSNKQDHIHALEEDDRFLLLCKQLLHTSAADGVPRKCLRVAEHFS